MRVAVFNQKGGVGKTTTVLNLGAALHRANQRPLLIDLDPQGHLTSVYGEDTTKNSQNLLTFFQEQCRLSDLYKPWKNTGFLIPAHQQLIKVDSIFGKGPSSLNKLRLGLDALDAEQNAKTETAREKESLGFSHTLIDCCPYIGVLALNAIFASDLLIIPVSTDYLSLQAAGHITHTLGVLEPVIKRRVDRRYLLTRFDKRRKMSTDIQQQLQARYGDEVLDVAIVENVSVAESPAVNCDVFSHQPSSSGAYCYQALLLELRERGDL